MKNQTIILVSSLLLIGSAVSCNLFGKKSDGSRNKETNKSADSSIVAANSKSSAADCPQKTLWIIETKNKALEKYEGCLLRVQGKIWEIEGDNKIVLTNQSDMTGYDDKFLISGDFSNSTYSKIGDQISEIKLKGDYEKLPIVTFTCAVGSEASLESCFLTE